MIEEISEYVAHEVGLSGEVNDPKNLSVLLVERGFLRRPHYARILAFIFRKGEKHPILIAKFGRLPIHNPRIKMEYQNMSAIWQDAQEPISPRPLRLEPMDGRLVLFEEYKSGRNMENDFMKLARSTHGTHALLSEHLQHDLETAGNLLKAMEALYVANSSGELIDEFDSLAEFDRAGRNFRAYVAGPHFEEALCRVRDVLLCSGMQLKQGLVNFDFSASNILVEVDHATLVDWEWSMNTGLIWIMPLHFVFTYMGRLQVSTLATGRDDFFDLMKGGFGEAGTAMRRFLSAHGVETREPWLRWAQLFTYVLFERSMFLETYEDQRFRLFDGLIDKLLNDYELMKVQYRVFDLLTAVQTKKEELIQVQSALETREAEFTQTQSALKGREEELGQTRAALQSREAELRQERAALEAVQSKLAEIQSALESREAELGQVQLELQSRGVELDQTSGLLQNRETELGMIRNKGKSIAYELDLFRHRRIIRWVNRLRAKSDAWNDISQNFQQLKDDSLIFTKGLKGFRLQPSVNLQGIAFLYYPLDLNRPNLEGVLLAPIIDLPLMKGVFGIEIVSTSNDIVAQCVIQANELDESFPTRFDFVPIQGSDQGRLWMRVFVREVDMPVRVLEWQKYSLFGAGRMRRRAFCGFLFEDIDN